MLMHTCNFGEDQQKENHIFLKVVKETTFKRAPHENVNKKTDCIKSVYYVTV
jgi:hypothetical protein